MDSYPAPLPGDLIVTSPRSRAVHTATLLLDLMTYARAPPPAKRVVLTPLQSERLSSYIDSLPLYLQPDGGDAIVKKRGEELILWLKEWKTDTTMFLKTSIRLQSKTTMFNLLKFLDKSTYEDWVNDSFGARFADFEMEGKKYKIVFYSKKMDNKEFDDWGNKEYILIILNLI